MKDKKLEIIKTILERQEKERKIKILLAALKGSRTYGLESEESDYDVMFIYVRPLEDYLRIDTLKDTITIKQEEYQTKEGSIEVEITGWDIRKTLTQLGKSNLTLEELFAEDNIEIITTEESEKFKKYVKETHQTHVILFSLKGKLLRAYDRLYEQGEVEGLVDRLVTQTEDTLTRSQLKYLIAVIRERLNMLWVKEYKRVKPNTFTKVLEEVSRKNKEVKELKPTIERLVELRKTGTLEPKASDRDDYTKLYKFVERQVSQVREEVYKTDATEIPEVTVYTQEFSNYFREIIDKKYC